MLISPKCRSVNNNPNMDILLGDNALTEVEVADYLGIRIDHELSWDCYIKKLCSSLSYKIQKLSRLRDIAPPHVLRKIYTATIQPVIDYAICSWGFSYNYNIDKVQRLQNYAARIVSNNFDYINTRGLDIVRSLVWMNVRQRRNYFTCVNVFKCLHSSAPAYLADDFTLCCELDQPYMLRSGNSRDVIVPYISSSCIKSSFKYNGAILWNELPAEIKHLSDICVFKRTLKDFIFTLF